MIRVMTLNAAAQIEQSFADQRAQIAFLHHGAIDLLCCQSVPTPLPGCVNFSRLLSDSLNLTCSNIVAGSQRVGEAAEANHGGRGLALFTGRDIWVLNGGGLAIGESNQEELVQFSVVRRTGISLLVLNLHLAASAATQESQLRALFSHPLLKESYGAVLFCADKSLAISGSAWQGILARSAYQAQCVLSQPNAECMLVLLTVKDHAVTSVTVHCLEPVQFTDTQRSAVFPNLALDLEIHRIAAGNRNRFSFPLSFREQWLGYKEHRTFA